MPLSAFVMQGSRGMKSGWPTGFDAVGFSVGTLQLMRRRARCNWRKSLASLFRAELSMAMHPESSPSGFSAYLTVCFSSSWKTFRRLVAAFFAGRQWFFTMQKANAMLKLKRVAALCAVVGVSVTLSAGCATVEMGRDFDATKAQTFQKGKTSRGDVIGAMGAPSSTGHNSEGSFIEYQYGIHKGGGLSDLLGAYGVGSIKTDSKNKLCRFVFDPNDKLKDYTCSESGPNYAGLGK